MKTIGLLAVIFLQAWICRAADRGAPYNFLHPDKVYELPEVLKEISGIAFDGKDKMYCVQDEIGAVFQFDIQKEEITGMFRFSDVGDFEDLAIRDDQIYVLRSDGAVFSFNYKNYDGVVKQVSLPVSCINMEGLCYDPAETRFLIACKDYTIGEETENRIIYASEAGDLSEVRRTLTIEQEKTDIFWRQKYTQAPADSIRINPSAVAVHPVTGDIYVLSASDRLMAIFRENRLVDIIALPSELYYKPEGMTFSGSGDLYLSSEGMKKNAPGGQIFFFSYKGN